MTPEQQKQLDEMVTMFEENRDRNAAEMKDEDGLEAFALWERSIATSTEEFLEAIRREFKTEPADHPLLALALTQLIGSQVQHLLTEHHDAPPEVALPMLLHAVMGTLETIVHTSIQAVQAKKNL